MATIFFPLARMRRHLSREGYKIHMIERSMASDSEYFMVVGGSIDKKHASMLDNTLALISREKGKYRPVVYTHERDETLRRIAERYTPYVEDDYRDPKTEAEIIGHPLQRPAASI